MALDEVYEYFRAYDRQSFAVFACAGSEPSDDDLVAFEDVIGFRMPDEFREFTMSPLGGLYVEVKEELWPRAKLYAAGPFWSFLYGLKVFGISAEIPDWLDIRIQTSEMASQGYGQLAPFLQVVGDANKFCFNSLGEIVLWDHETDEQRVIDATFSELLMQEIRDLETRKDQKLRGEDRPQPAGEIRPEFQRSYAQNKPCPHCGKPLRSNQAQQCFECGANWRGETND